MTSRWLLTGALALAACTDARQIVLSIDTTARVPCDIDRIRVVAKAAGTTVFDQSLNGDRLPVTVTLLDDTPNGSFQVDISGLKGDAEMMRTSGSLQFSSHKAIQSVLLAPTCTPDAHCELADAMADGAASPATPRLSCGAHVTRYSGSMAPDSFLENPCNVPGAVRLFPSGGGPPVQRMDMELEDKLRGADFQFYGRPIRQIWVAKDGYLSFTQDNPDPDGHRLPGSLDLDIKHVGPPPPLQSVMAFWDTLSVRPMGVCYVLDGAAPYRQLRVTWAGACLTDTCTTDNLNFTITLEETSHRIVLTYGDMVAGNSAGAHGLYATVGLVDDPIGCPAEECSLATGLCKGSNTPCGYSQVFSDMIQPDKPPNMQFLPVVDPE
jgi:hypothetical protein